MFGEWKVVTSIFLTTIAGSLFAIKYLSTSMPPVTSPDVETVVECPICPKNDRRFLYERNDLSRRMNKMSQERAKKSCEILTQYSGRIKPVHHSGGWCERNVSYGHQTDNQLAQALANFLIGKKVGSFGDGPGHYKNIIDKSSLVQTYDAYDGGPYYEEMTKGRVKYLDLSIPQYGLPLYDWVVSLEVAEHIPAEYESVYLDNLIRHAKEGIILSWAVPGQDGHYHINNRAFTYVVKTLDSLGFVYSESETTILRQSATLPWLRANTSVFRRKAERPVNMDDL